ncbi:unnamed protein product [Nesidiocoris tenuis]|uniref:NADH dehydrogenase (Ubiquinone) 1 alpha subcomplex n=2 Tax=Nesidiocoris tenuis TaxID=355587 RepID=A0ABN7A659_9HEMI|nr:NADH dehydrogenase (ubiquinone) 1 alpha subcomplex [Nesidiocoris tenuis]CAA9998656.1 unnamed protein product [Nesidiocoris tenuis]
MATAARKQDGPPPGGYKPLDFSRVPARSVIGAKSLIAGYLAMSGAAFYLYFQNYKKIHRDDVEVRSSMMAITPLLMAEHDREYLKQLRRNRDEEAKLMANVKGWETGKYKGEPIFKTLPPDTLVKPIPLEYFAHGTMDNYQDWDNILLWQ